ncbi:MAG: PQQ-dependent sugar dehydrogenase, partial [Gemmatimonadota bacterium]
MRLILCLLILWTSALPAQTASPQACWVYQTPDARFRLEVVASGLHVPVSLAFLPDRTHALLAERPTGRLSLLDLNTGATLP